MTGRLEGTIYKATAGFYYVACEGDLTLECRGRGIFRKEGVAPCVGDRVMVQRNDKKSGTVDEILPRRNVLIRPPLANLDYMVVVLSVVDPAPNMVVIDKYLAILEYKEIEPLIAITKSDLADAGRLAALYENAGFTVFVTDCITGSGVEPLMAQLAGKFSGFSGNSGVGKSSLLNAIVPELALAVGDTSKKLGRGRHTTRHVETFSIPGGGFVADTPGFTSLELLQMSEMTHRDLADCFRDFNDYAGRCKFQDCTHTCEKGCAVLAAVEDGTIARSRHDSFRQLYNEIKDVKEWERHS